MTEPIFCLRVDDAVIGRRVSMKIAAVVFEESGVPSPLYAFTRRRAGRAPFNPAKPAQQLYQRSFNPSCICREGVDVEASTPAFPP